MASPCNDNKRCSRHGRSTEAKAVRNAAILILYLLLAAGIFGSVLLYSIVWFTRCRDAVAVSHTASEFAQAYAGMDPTKTREFKASFNSTTRRVLDGKLPMLISRTCVSCGTSVHKLRRLLILGCVRSLWMLPVHTRHCIGLSSLFLRAIVSQPLSSMSKPTTYAKESQKCQKPSPHVTKQVKWMALVKTAFRYRWQTAT